MVTFHPTAIIKDAPPYCIASQLNQFAGLNIIGMRRADIPADIRTSLKRTYRAVFSSSNPLQTTVTDLLGTSPPPEIQIFLRALTETSGRGVCFPRCTPSASSHGETPPST